MNKKLKIALFNWAPIHGNFNQGGGVTIYLKNIAHAFSQKGHSVSILSSGFFYDLSTSNIYFRCHSENNLKYVDIVNSRVLAPAFFMFHNLKLCVQDYDTTHMIRRFLREHGPFDVFHIQNVEGIPWNVMALRKEFPNTKFILSNHNYHAVCQQVNLWYNESEVCNDYYDGISCYSCRTHEPQLLLFLADRDIITRTGKKTQKADLPKIEKTLLTLQETGGVTLTPYKLNDKTFDKESIDLFGKNKFIIRRKIAADLINENCDVVICVSQEVQDILSNYGIKKEKMVVNYIGTRLFSGKIKTKPRLTPEKLHLCFMGYARTDKGFHFLVDAFENMPNDLLGKISFTFAGIIDDVSAMQRIKNCQKKLADLKIIDSYTHDQVPLILSNIDVGLVPPLWYDALPQVAIEFICNGVPILVSDRGGQKEIINHNDFVFSAGNTTDFWNKVRKILHSKEIIEDFWHSGVTVFNIDQHINTLINLYTQTTRPTSYPNQSSSPSRVNIPFSNAHA